MVSRKPHPAELRERAVRMVFEVRIAELEREVRKLRRANVILKAASAYFARELDPRLPRWPGSSIHTVTSSGSNRSARSCFIVSGSFLSITNAIGSLATFGLFAGHDKCREAQKPVYATD